MQQLLKKIDLPINMRHSVLLFLGVVFGAVIAQSSGQYTEAQSVTVGIANFSYNPTPKRCDNTLFGKECDTRFDIEYRWNGQVKTIGVTEEKNLDVRYFGNWDQRLNGPLAVGAVVEAKVIAWDVDPSGDEFIGEFHFNYTIPAVRDEYLAYDYTRRPTYSDPHGQFSSWFMLYMKVTY